MNVVSLSALFTAALVGATLVPLSSEVAVVAALATGLPPTLTVAVATAGNCLGVTLNYWLGFSGNMLLHRLFPKKRITRAIESMNQYGYWALWLSWMPVIGDPLTAAAGILRVPFTKFAAVAFSTRLLRYILIAITALAFARHQG